MKTKENSAWNLEGKNVLFHNFLRDQTFSFFFKTPIDSSQSITAETFNNGIFSVMTVSLHFRRLTLFYIFTLILPTIVIASCTILGSLLPARSHEKIGLRKEFFFNLS